MRSVIMRTTISMNEMTWIFCVPFTKQTFVTKIVFKTDPKEKRIVESFCLACINVVLFNKRNEKRNGKSLVGMVRGHLICKFVVSLVNLNEKEKN